MSTTYICFQVEKALQKFLQDSAPTGIPTDQIYKGVEHGVVTPGEQLQRKLPCVICTCQEAEPFAQISGSWMATAQVQVVTSADDHTDEEHQDLAAAVFDKLITENLERAISTPTLEFSCDLVVWGNQSWGPSERTWVATQVLTLYCQGSDI